MVKDNEDSDHIDTDNGDVDDDDNVDELRRYVTLPSNSLFQWALFNRRELV